MIARALPDLLDAPATEELRGLIRTTVANVLPKDHIISIRTRRSGPTTFAVVTVSGAAFASVAALHEATAAIADELRRTGAEVDLMIVPLVEGGPPKADDEAIDALLAAPRARRAERM
jgi:divalent metal cation (Fe/Co/Zn/Cd) transporter